MNQIVVGVDGSEAATDALKMAAKLAGPMDARLTLVHVKRPILLSPDPYEHLIDEMRLQAERESNAILEHAVRNAEAAGASVEVLSPEGPVAESLALIAEERKALMLVVGSRGRNAVARVMLGSVADRAVHISKVPVLVARSGAGH
jgi:nucleotide-binding universal stress UspA family protein